MPVGGDEAVKPMGGVGGNLALVYKSNQSSMFYFIYEWPYRKPYDRPVKLVPPKEKLK
jgi:hypothetical protein